MQGIKTNCKAVTNCCFCLTTTEISDQVSQKKVQHIEVIFLSTKTDKIKWENLSSFFKINFCYIIIQLKPEPESTCYELYTKVGISHFDVLSATHASSLNFSRSATCTAL